MAPKRKLKSYIVALKRGARLDNITFDDLGDIKDPSGKVVLEWDGVASAVNYVRLANAATTAGPVFSAQGSDTNVDFNVTTKGTGTFSVFTGASARTVFDAVNVASSVNYIRVTPAATGSGPSVSAVGTDTNIAVTVAGKGTGAVLLGQATSAGVTLVADQPILDSSSNEFIKFAKIASAVNEITVTNAATGTSPIISATGGDATANVLLASKGSNTGVLSYSTDAGATGPVIGTFHDSASPAASDTVGQLIFQGRDSGAAQQTYGIIKCVIGDPTAASEDATIVVTAVNAGTTQDFLTFDPTQGIRMGAGMNLYDANSNELVKFTQTASAVNEITITNQITAVAPSIAATGGDTHIGLQLDAKGTASIVALDPILEAIAANSITADSNQTITAAQMMGGVLIRSGITAARTDTTPTAAQLVTQAGPGVAVNSGRTVFLLNQDDASDWIVAAGAGITFSPTGNKTMTAGDKQNPVIVFTNVTGGAEAVTIYW